MSVGNPNRAVQVSLLTATMTLSMTAVTPVTPILSRHRSTISAIVSSMLRYDEIWIYFYVSE